MGQCRDGQVDLDLRTRTRRSLTSPRSGSGIGSSVPAAPPRSVEVPDGRWRRRGRGRPPPMGLRTPPWGPAPRRHGRGDLVGLAVTSGVAAGRDPGPRAGDRGRRHDRGRPGRRGELRPRGVWWSNDTATALSCGACAWPRAGTSPRSTGCSSAVGPPRRTGRLGATCTPGPRHRCPTTGPLDLFGRGPRRSARPATRRIRSEPTATCAPDWVSGGWAASTGAAWPAGPPWRWSASARQQDALARAPDPSPGPGDGPVGVGGRAAVRRAGRRRPAVDRAAAEAVIAGFVGPRPRTQAERRRRAAPRDDEVLRHAPDGRPAFDLRSPGQVKSLLRRVGIEVPDTRAWRLEALRDAHPVIEPLLAWRKAERVETTYGYRWLDEHVGADGRLRGDWSGSDGAAGRMTASAGLHNMPADLRRRGRRRGRPRLRPRRPGPDRARSSHGACWPSSGSIGGRHGRSLRAS